MNRKIIYISMFLSIMILEKLQAQRTYKTYSTGWQYLTGSILDRFKITLFTLPREVYGVYISFNDHNVVIDSFSVRNLEPDSTIINNESIMTPEVLNQTNTALYQYIKQNIPPDLLDLFKKYKVYYLCRSDKNFSPSDTLPHFINTIKGPKKVVSENKNKILWISFDPKMSVIEFRKELEKTGRVIETGLNYRIRVY